MDLRINKKVDSIKEENELIRSMKRINRQRPRGQSITATIKQVNGENI